MEIEDSEEVVPLKSMKNTVENSGTKEGKRTKWQPPPSHQHLTPSPPRKNFTTHRQSPRNEVTAVKLDRPTDIEGKDIEFSDDTSYAQQFAKKTNHSLEEIVNVLNTPNIYRLDSMARAEICPKIHRARLMSTKGIAAKIREQYGYEICNTTFLYAEEALYLLETGKLDLYLGRVSLSVERARTLLLDSKFSSENHNSKIKTCSVEEYLVYKHLSQLGYRLCRRDQNGKMGCYPIPASPEQTPITTSSLDSEMKMDSEDEETMMELDEDSVVVGEAEKFIVCDDFTTSRVPSISSQSSTGPIGKNNSSVDYNVGRGVKRKIGEVCGNETGGSSTPTSSAKDVTDNEDADEEIDFPPSSGDVCMDANIPTMEQTGVYTVTEADSDEDIIDYDEIVRNDGVQIEEIGYGYDGDIEDDSGIGKEPIPSTSAGCFQSLGVVHLADSSDSETEEIKSFSKVLNKLVPNATIQIGFPPSAVLPENIPSRQTIYEFDLKSKEKRGSDSELEYFVDELNLNASPGESDNDNNKCSSRKYKNWKDWRLGTLKEAKDVLEESLMAEYHTKPDSTENAMKTLHLWDLKEDASEEWKCFNIPFDLYHPSAGSNKRKLKNNAQPCYAVAVVKNDDTVPSFSACSRLLNGVPVLVALVSDDSGILFMNPDRSPIPSLF